MILRMTSKRKRVIVFVVSLAIVLIAGAWLGIRIGIAELRYSFYRQRLSEMRDVHIPDIRGGDHKEVYRFFWSRSFHPPVLISVFVQDNEHAVLNVKVADIPEGDKAGALNIDRDVDLDSSDIEGLRRVVDSNRFWRERVPHELVPDGSSWAIEVKRGRKYHLNAQNSPKEGSIRNIGFHLIGLSGLELTPQEIY